MTVIVAFDVFVLCFPVARLKIFLVDIKNFHRKKNYIEKCGINLTEATAIAISN